METAGNYLTEAAMKTPRPPVFFEYFVIRGGAEVYRLLTGAAASWMSPYDL
jgi:hypothetical protein